MIGLREELPMLIVKCTGKNPISGVVGDGVTDPLDVVE